MELSLIYFAFLLRILLSTADPTEFDSQCPTSRRLLLFGGLVASTGEKKSHHPSSSSKVSSPPSSPPKYARSSDSHGLIVYVRPQSSTERGHRGRSYTHLLKSKVGSSPDKVRIKRSTIEKQKQQQQQQRHKKKDSPQHKSAVTTKTQELVAINDQELSRCRALLHIDSIDQTVDNKKVKKDKSIKQARSSKVKDATNQAAKNIKKKVLATTTTTTTALPRNDKKVKTTSKTNPDQRKSPKIVDDKTNEKRTTTLPVENIPVKTPSLQSTTSTKSKRDKPQPIPIVEEPTSLFDSDEDELENQNSSVVNRALHFVKNMFQLSDDLLNDDHTSDNHILDLTNEQQHHHHSRKLLTIDDIEQPIVAYNNTDVYEFDLYFHRKHSIETTDEDLSFLATSISKRQLLSVKTNKHATTSKATISKGKKSKPSTTTTTTTADANKPKVGWAYRYRISRYLEAQKMKRTGNKNKVTAGGKTKPSKQQEQRSNSKQNHKKTSTSNDAKVSKRKLLQYPNSDDSSCSRNDISDPDIVNSVSITENFIPKRQLLATKTKTKKDHDKTDVNDDGAHDDLQKSNKRRQMKSFEELTDPVAIVDSYDRGLFKPRVGWQFRYRVSRYIDSLRENIREDQERLKLGLQAIKRKSPQELSGRRKRVLDKPFVPDADELKKQNETQTAAQENNTRVGWRYRYRVSKMNEAKERGDYINDEEEKRKVRLEQKQKQKQANHTKSRQDVRERIEGENDLDWELRQVNDEGRRVGWAYRYRVRRKLDDLKRQQAETGTPFNLATLGGKREKKVVESKTKPAEKKATESATEPKTGDKKKSAGWEYRYRLSKMREGEKRDKSKTNKPEKIPVHEQIDPELARLTPEQRVVGWKYRYRIRRKLDATKNSATGDVPSGKRTKKSPSKRKDKEKIIKKVEESIEKILNIDDIDETPFMEYFRRGSSYVLFGLVPAAKKSICLLPLPVTVSFCKEDATDQISAPSSTTTTTKKSKRIPKKKLKTKKEQRAKQFIHSHSTKLGADDKATERRVDETMKKLYKKPSLPPPQIPPSSSSSIKDQKPHEKQRQRTTKRSNYDQRGKRLKEDENSIKKEVGVDSKKNKNKKQFQIIGQKVKIKNKHTTPSSTVTTSTPLKVNTSTTTSPPRLRTISEVIQDEAFAILGTNRKSGNSPEEVKAEMDEANEIVRERTKIQETTTQSIIIGSTTSGDEQDLTSSDRKTSRENVKRTVHDVLKLEKDKNSA